MTWFSPTTVLKAAASSLRHAEVLRELAGYSCHTKHNKPALICIMLHFLLMFCDYTPESSFYDVIRCDIMANNEQLMYTVVYQPPLLLIILQQDKNIRQFALTGRTVSTPPPSYILESTFPATVCSKLTPQWVFQVQVVKCFMFFAAYVQQTWQQHNSYGKWFIFLK